MSWTTEFLKEWDDLATTTLDDHRTKLRDVTFKEIAMLNFMEANGRVDRQDAGEQVSYPLLKDKNSTLMRLTPEDAYKRLDTTPQTGLTRAFYDWRMYNISITISRYERNVNSGGPEKLLDLLMVKTKQARKTVREAFHEDMIAGDGSNDGIHGLKFLLEEQTDNVGRIPESAVNNDGVQFWKPERITSGVTATNLKEKMRTMLNNLRIVDSEPDLILSDQATHEEYKKQVEDKAETVLVQGGMPKIGFGFKGNEAEFAGIPFVWDRHMPANTIYFLNFDSLGLVFHSDGEFDLGEMRTPTDQHASTAHIFVQAQMVCSNRRDQGVINNINLSA